MYYVGNKEECEAYEQQVRDGEKYQDTTVRWANIIEHHEEDLYAVKKHPNYDTDLEERDDISDFYPEEDEI